MKLWIKIYLFSLCLLTLTLNIAGVILIEELHNNLLRKEIESCISKQKFVCMQLNINSMSVTKTLDVYHDLNTTIGKLMYEYNSSTNHDLGIEGDIEILDLENNILYTDVNFPISDEKDELVNSSEESTNYIIRTVNNKQYIYVVSLVNMYNTKIKVHYAKDITDIYKERNIQYNFFIKLSIFICFLFAIFMFFISKLITKPINTLIDSTKKIIDGDYSYRVRIKSKDEFNTLSNHFNSMAETVENKINELEKSNVEKESLINNLTHELKTPLTSIIGYSNIIRTAKYDEKLFIECADYIYNQGKRLEQMTFKMMNLIYAKTQKIELKSENLKTIICEAKRSLKVKLNAKNIDLIICGKDYELDVDKDLMQILLCNLIENSIKASEYYSKIYVKVKDLDNKIIISIQDFGIGIPKEHLKRIFEPFYVVDKARSRKNNGAGIGLSICRKIIEVHNAEMNIDSELGRGTIITIIFNNT